MGGEKSPVLSVAGFPTGSPPRGRGKVQFGIHALGGVGITPAWAGKSILHIHSYLLEGDHPRVGGEKLALSPLLDVLKGSPPRGRGKDHVAEVIAHGTGITPAWAGKRAECFIVCCSTWDHPRVGGEKSLDMGHFRYQRGSPPRGRGKGFFCRVDRLHGGITPAWAGKSEILLL